LKKAAAIVIRHNKTDILMGTRTQKARSFPGFMAFPGGAVEEEDLTLPLLTETGSKTGGDDAHADRAAALRELGEETGIWFLADREGGAPTIENRRCFTENLGVGLPIADALSATELVLDDSALVPLGQWTTPAFMPRRYQVRQFMIDLQEKPQPCTDPCDEFDEVGFRSIDSLMKDWSKGHALLLPPVWHIVSRLASAIRLNQSEEEMVRNLENAPNDCSPTREIIQGICVQPLRTPTLPPAAHTNTIFLGSGDYYIVDPATPYADEQQKLDEMIAYMERDGRKPLALLLTHHHHDHIGDVERLRKQLSVPLWAHAQTSERLIRPADRCLNDGETIDCPGSPTRHFQVIHTPGHAPGHLCFWEEELSILVAGDMVAATGSILIEPGDGHMGTYMKSLEKLARLSPRRLVAAHGPLLADGLAKIKEQIEHRNKRQQAVQNALLEQVGGALPSDLVPEIYGHDTPVSMMPLAALSVHSALIYCVETGHATREGERFFATAPPGP
jgi:endoribonuclease LACTB2